MAAGGERLQMGVEWSSRFSPDSSDAGWGDGGARLVVWCGCEGSPFRLSAKNNAYVVWRKRNKRKRRLSCEDVR